MLPPSEGTEDTVWFYALCVVVGITIGSFLRYYVG